MGMSLVRGDESPEEILIIAYGMEEGLREFYSETAGRMDDVEIVDLFKELSEVEEKHKQRLFTVYLEIDKSVSDKEGFESRIVKDVMEGGFTTREFLEKNEEALKTVPDIINIAMMLETQALDLYLRYSQRISDPKGREILYDIAEEEKTHLRTLGRLMDSKG
jgi:rubrerythrin